MLLGCQRMGDPGGLRQAGKEVGLAGREGVVHRQVAEDVADHLQILGIDHDRLGAVVAGHDAEQIKLDRHALEKRIHDDRRARFIRL